MFDLLQAHDVARTVVTRAIHMLNDEPGAKIMRTGAYLTVMNRHTGQVVLQALICAGPSEKVAKWRLLSEEKATRLFRNLHLGHTTSYESQDKSQDQYPGAILGRDYLWSLSGLPASVDEASMLVTSIRLGDCDEAGTLAVISEERNPNLRPLLEVAHWTE